MTRLRTLLRAAGATVDGDDERGVVLILVALVMTLLLVVAAIVIDVGNVGQERRQAQNAADAAALAGATDIQNGDTTPVNIVTLIKNYVASNYGTVTWSGCVDSAPLSVQPDATSSCISWDKNPPNTTQVRVVLPTRAVPTTFGRVVGITSFNVAAAAIATVGQGNIVIPAPCALCSLASSDIQNGNIGVTGGPMIVNGNLTCNSNGSVTTSGNPQPAIDVSGTASGGCLPGGMNPAPTNGAPVIPDPLSSLPDNPDYSGLTAKPDCYSGTASPGIYTNIGGTCNLNPGLYVVTGTFGGSGSGTSIVGHGVTVFFACGTVNNPKSCNNNQQGGTLSIGGSTNMDVTACTASPCTGGAVQGMVLWFDRNNATTMSMGGTGSIGFVGTVYGKSITLSVNGTPHSGTGSCAAGGLCSEVVVNNVTMSGQGTLDVTFLQSQNVPITRVATIPQLLS